MPGVGVSPLGGGPMTATRLAAVALLAASVAASCTSGHANDGDGSTSAPSTTCAKADAEHARGSFVTKAGFDPSCARVKVKGQFFFVNNEQGASHEVATQPGSPASFDVKLPKKQSTYTQVFSKRGTYVIVDKATNHSMTLYVG